jgi:hypothetical protein
MNPDMTPDEARRATRIAKDRVQAIEASLPPAAAFVIFTALIRDILSRTIDLNHTWMTIIKYELSTACGRIARDRDRERDGPLPDCLYNYVLQSRL